MPSNPYYKQEEGDNKLPCSNNLNGISKTSQGKNILDFDWNHFKINFNIHNIPSNQNIFMQIEGSPDSLSNWQSNNKRPIKMELQNNKEITAKDGNKIKGFWTVTFLKKITEKKILILNIDFHYLIKIIIWLYGKESQTDICIYFQMRKKYLFFKKIKIIWIL